MCGFEAYNPRIAAIYLLTVALITMFSMNPIILILSFVGAFSLFLIRNRLKGLNSHFMLFSLFVVTSLINPLFYHNGVTVLFVLNNNPITLEATLYGIMTGVMLVSTLYWFRTFTQIMTSDKLLYLFGSVSIKSALILSMALRYIPLFNKQAKKIDKAQICLGLYKEDNIIDDIKGKLRVFSAMMTWSLEHGIITADSMAARGYGIGKRTSFSIYKMNMKDYALLAITALLSINVIIGVTIGKTSFEYYPALHYTSDSLFSILTYVSFGVLSILPVIIEIKEAVKWKYLESKI